jgi:hypothetical protein
MSREGVSAVQIAPTQKVVLALSRPAFDALVGEGGSGRGQIERRLQGAIRLYLKDKASGRAAWPYPSFLRGSETAADVPLEVELDADLANAFAAEASEQSVSVSQLAEHAAFYFAAELDAGRATQRILDDPGDSRD